MSRAGLTVVLTAVLLAGCTGLAHDDEVQPGLPIEVTEPPIFDYVPPGPNAGASPEATVRGFVRAGAASEGTYEVARRYLTDTALRDWSPDSTVVVYDSSKPLTVTPIGGGSYRLSGVLTAQIGTDGRVVPAATGARTHADVGLVKGGDGWRISAVPKGLGRWISSSDFTRLFASESVHYLSRSGDSLVPDERWFPRDHLATRLAAAQLEEPPAHLRGSVRSLVPAGARLGNPGVTVLDGTAVVDLAVRDLTTDTTGRRELWAQFATTLTQLTSVSKVLLRNDGATVEFSGRPEGGLTASDLGLSVVPSSLTVLPVLRDGSTLIQLDVPRIREYGGFGADRLVRRTYVPVPTAFESLALSSDGVEVAAVREDGTLMARWRNGTQYDVPVSAQRMGRPSYDAFRYLWFGATGSTQGRSTVLWYVDTGVDPADPVAAAARRIDVPWLAGRVVLAAKPSPGGERLLVLSTDARGGDARAQVSGIIRAAGGEPRGLAGPLDLAQPLGRLVDATWFDPVTVGILGAEGKGPLQPWVQSLNGSLRPLAATPDAVAIASLGGERDTIVVGAEGEIRIRGGSLWIHLAQGSDLAVPGN